MKKFYLIFYLILFSFTGKNFAQTIDPNFSPKFTATGQVQNVANYLDEKILISGSFKFIGEHPANSFARLLSDGSPDVGFSMDPAIIGYPSHFVTQSDGKILIAGDFFNTDNELLGNILRLNPNGNLDESFQAIGNGEDEYIKIKILPNQKILAASKNCEFNSTGSGCQSSKVELFEADGQPDVGFNTYNVNYTPLGENEILSIGVESNNSFLIVGRNLQAGNTSPSIIRINSDGTVNSDFNPQITFPSGYAGELIDVDITPNGTIGVISPDGANFALLEEVGTVIQSYFFTNLHGQMIALADNSFFISGDKVIRILDTGERFEINGLTDFNWFLNVAEWNNGVLGAGFFTSVGFFDAPGIVNYDISNDSPQLDQSFRPAVLRTGNIQSVVVQEDEKVVAMGSFRMVNGEEREGIVRLNSDGSVDPTFNINFPQGANPGDLKMQSDGSLIIGFANAFQTLNRYDRDGNLLEVLPFPPHPGSNSGVRYLAIDSEDRIYAGDGTAFSTNGESSQGLKKYDFTQGNLEVTDYDLLYMNGLVRFNGLLTQKDDKLLIFGNGINYDNSLTTPIIRTNLTGERDFTFSTDLSEDLSIRSMIITNQNNYFVSGSTFAETEVYRLNENGEIDFSLTDDFTINDYLFYAPSKFFNVPFNLVFANGNFNSFKNNPASSGKILMDVEGNFVQEFLPQIKAANFNDVAFLDSTTVYIAGNFSNQEGSSLMRVSFIPTSIDEEFIAKNEMEIFPNPVNVDQVTVKLPEVVIGKELSYSILEEGSGKLVRSGKVQIQNQTKIGLRDIPAGNYILRVEEEQRVWISKLIRF